MKITRFFIIIMLMASISCAKTGKASDEAQSATSAIIDTISAAGYHYDSFTTPAGRTVNVAFIKHGSLIVDLDGYLVYVDPVTMFGNDFSKLPKADMILVSHEHHDHFDPKALELLGNDATSIFASKAVAEQCEKAMALLPGDSIVVDAANFELTIVPAYNNTAEHLQFHPKERGDLGFLFNIDGFTLYIGGDTEDIEEMASFGKIDVAFIPVNQPFTMTVDQVIHAAEMLAPTYLYPYHYGETDLTPLVERFADSEIDVRVRDLQ
ncbi:MAG: MBL fold metallo-hydrolase [Muribaculaceae bacterium]|nr:MBL fold metallo-hydrolase [Muribaculaceae bacterium]